MASMETDEPESAIANANSEEIEAISNLVIFKKFDENELKISRRMAAPPDIRFKRFIHYGSEEAEYKPGRKDFKLTNIKSVDALIKAGKHTDPVNHMLKATMAGYITNKEAILFALAYCCKQKHSLELKGAAYPAVQKICITAKDLFIFNRYCCQLENKMSSGSGWKKAIHDWYLNKSAIEMAQTVTKCRGYFKISHKDLFKLSHIKSEDVAQQAVINYVCHGYKDTVNKFSEFKEAQNVLSYLSSVEDYKHTNDVNIAARLIDSHSLSFEYLSTHGNLVKSREIWLALIPSMSTKKLLDCLQSFSVRGFFKGKTPFTSRYCEFLNNNLNVAESGVQPAKVFIELRTYELRAKEKIAAALKLNLTWASKRTGAPPKHNRSIIEALQLLFNSTFKMLVPTGLRYLIAMDNREKMWTNRCWHSPYVMLGEAAILIALNIIKTEREVVFGTFVESGLFLPIEVHKNMTMVNLTNKVKAVPPSVGPPLARTTFLWAEHHEKIIDVFLVLGDSSIQVHLIAPELMRYRKRVELPNAKIITCSLNGPVKKARDAQGNGQLCIYGFDEHVPRVIEAYSRGAF